MAGASSLFRAVEGVTARVAEAAHAVGAGVRRTGRSRQPGNRRGRLRGRVGRQRQADYSQLLTNPEQAADFVLPTRCAALAIACGPSHGAYKFTRKPDGKIPTMHVIQAIHDRLPDTHLVMQGSSSVPQHLQDVISNSGRILFCMEAVNRASGRPER